MRKRNIPIAFRVTEKELNAIDKQARKAKLDRTNYLIAAGIGKEITIVDGINDMLPALKRIGNNINQLSVLAHTGRIHAVNLDAIEEQLQKIYEELYRIGRENEVK